MCGGRGEGRERERKKKIIDPVSPPPPPPFFPSPHVAFCGYSIPHPSEKTVNLRIQTTGDISAAAALRQAAADLRAATVALRDTLAAAVGGSGEAGAKVEGAPPAMVTPGGVE